MEKILLSPPAALIILLAVALLLSALGASISFKSQKRPEGLEKAYTGGELVETHRVQPDYSQFFPFAFYFMILHVVTLVIATSPTENAGSFAIAAIYLFGAVLGLVILFRNEKL
jgi:NADH-quinone oxidoreductase subunit A